MTNIYRCCFSIAAYTVALIGSLLSLSGCPTGPAAGGAKVTISNVTSQINITNIRLIGPDDTRPGANLLNGLLRQGDEVTIGITAPDIEAMPEGVVWTVIASGQLNVRVKQDDPDDNRSQLNTNFDSLDTDDNNELASAEVIAGNPSYTQLDFDILDLNGDNVIARGEVGSPIRIALARFTCVHDADEITWNFDGESPSDFCADAP